MKNIFKRSFVFGLAMLAMSGCASENDKWGTEKVEIEDIPYTMEPEKVSGKLDVYNSMARAVKYNIEFASQNMKKKVAAPAKGMTARTLINSVIDAKTADANPLYNAIRVLDYAVIFAVSNLENSDPLKNEYIYEKSAQYLALGAIKSHQNTLFAQKKIRELERMMTKERKTVAQLNAKLESKGVLSDEEKEYKKGLEVALYEQGNFKKALEENVSQYEALIKFQDKKLSLEGRRFYELDDFDQNYELTVFQKTAVNNRSEFKKGKTGEKEYSFEGVQKSIFKSYPEVEHLQINGYEAKDPLYVQGLIKRANQTAENLVSATLGYARVDPKKVQEKEFVREKVLSELGAAIFEQVEMAYNMVKSSSVDYDVVTSKVRELTAEIRNKEKNYRSSMADKLEVLNLKLKLMEAESKQSQILAERAVALRSLYFYTGFSPFTQKLMEKDVKEVSAALRSAFNQDLIAMLSANPKGEKKKKPDDKDWSKQNNWLENVVDGASPESYSVPAKTKGSMSSGMQISEPATFVSESSYRFYSSPTYDGKMIMQLGSFTQCDSADTEWKNLQAAFPELKAYQPVVENAKVGGVDYYRLTVKSDKGGWVGLCNKLIQSGRGCILR